MPSGLMVSVVPVLVQVKVAVACWWRTAPVPFSFTSMNIWRLSVAMALPL